MRTLRLGDLALALICAAVIGASGGCWAEREHSNLPIIVSPDQRTLAWLHADYTAYSEGGHATGEGDEDIYVRWAGVSDLKPRQLKLGSHPGRFDYRAVTKNEFEHVVIAFSPDSARLAIGDRLGLRMLDLSTGRIRQLTTWQGEGIGHLAWLDSDQLVHDLFSGHLASPPGGLNSARYRIVRRSTSGDTTQPAADLVRVPQLFPMALHWSPKGQQVAFIQPQDGHSQAVLVDLRNGKITPIAPLDAGLIGIAWTADESIAAIAIDAAPGRAQLLIRNIRTGQVLADYSEQFMDTYRAPVTYSSGLRSTGLRAPTFANRWVSYDRFLLLYSQDQRGWTIIRPDPWQVNPSGVYSQYPPKPMGNPEYVCCPSGFNRWIAIHIESGKSVPLPEDATDVITVAGTDYAVTFGHDQPRLTAIRLPPSPTEPAASPTTQGDPRTESKP